MVKYEVIFMEKSVTKEKVIHLQQLYLLDSDKCMNEHT